MFCIRLTYLLFYIIISQFNTNPAIHSVFYSGTNHASKTVPGTECVSVALYVVNEQGDIQGSRWASGHVNKDNTVTFSARRGKNIALTKEEIDAQDADV